MLNLVIGRAGTGKTSYIMNEIKRKMSEGETGMLLIVPEQYSHDAEKQLCMACGDKLSVHAETLSFTRLCNNVLSETGGAACQLLDASGQILALYRALEAVASSLKAFGIKKMRTEILHRLLEAIKEFKSYNITPQMLENAAKQTTNPLADKLRDLALIYSAYDSLLQIHGGDAAERLDLLAEKIAESSVGTKGHIYFDGFNDFTQQEIRIIEELMQKKAKITVCITCDLDDLSEVFEIPRKTVTELKRLAAKHGTEITRNECKENLTSSRGLLLQAPELNHLEKHLFDDSPKKFQNQANAISVLSAKSRYNECEYAAYEVLRHVQQGFRWRDIAVMARNWEEYSAICENVFEKYDIPYFTSGKVDILSKPPMTVIDSALEIAALGFEYKSVFKYIKSGLIDITEGQCAIIENYVLKWQIRGTLWNRQWTMSPGGYNKSKDIAADNELLAEINSIRQKIVSPLLKLRDGIKGESKTEEKLRTLYRFLKEIKLPQKLTEKAETFATRGEKRLSGEYLQLWDIIVHALDQMYKILGSEKLNTQEFHRLLVLALSQNDIGIIPISLDRTPLGSMAMSRRRDIKCLILLGATDENIPALNKRAGALSESERTTLGQLGASIPAGLDERLSREMNMFYSTLTLPSDKLIVIYSAENGQRPSFIVKRLQKMFDIEEKIISPEQYMTIAKAPYFELQQKIEVQQGNSPLALPERLNTNLSKQAAELLYGKNVLLSATSIDNYYTCPYKHFLRNGLSLKPRMQADFDALTAGNFMHYVLDGVISEVKATDGFKTLEAEACNKLTEKYIDSFESDVLQSFEGKNTRFEYLFRRYRSDVKFVVSDMLKELRNSDFEPLELEFDMKKLSKTQTGFIDRVDGYLLEEKLYLRVIDYKTRKAAYTFDMTEVLHGRDLQMLIYLFALKKYGSLKYGKEVEAAGVLYVPARDVIISAPRDAGESEIDKLRTGEMRRNGLVLNEPLIIEAMEGGALKNYLPVKTNKDGEFTGSSLINNKQFEILANHVEEKLKNAKTNIQNGNNPCSPYYKNENDNACRYCDYHAVCGFDEEIGDKRRFIGKMKDEDVWNLLEN